MVDVEHCVVRNVSLELQQWIQGENAAADARAILPSSTDEFSFASALASTCSGTGYYGLPSSPTKAFIATSSNGNPSLDRTYSEDFFRRFLLATQEDDSLRHSIGSDAGARSIAEDREHDHCSGSNGSTLLASASAAAAAAASASASAAMSPRGPRPSLQRSIACQQVLECGPRGQRGPSVGVTGVAMDGQRGGADDRNASKPSSCLLVKTNLLESNNFLTNVGNDNGESGSHLLRGHPEGSSSSQLPLPSSQQQQQQHQLVEMAANLLAHGTAGADTANLDDLLKRLRSALLRSKPKKSPSSDALMLSDGTATTMPPPAATTTDSGVTVGVTVTGVAATVTGSDVEARGSGVVNASDAGKDGGSMSISGAPVSVISDSKASMTEGLMEGSGDAPTLQQGKERCGLSRQPPLAAVMDMDMASLKLAPPVTPPQGPRAAPTQGGSSQGAAASLSGSGFVDGQRASSSRQSQRAKKRDSSLSVTSVPPAEGRARSPVGTFHNLLGASGHAYAASAANGMLGDAAMDTLAERSGAGLLPAANLLSLSNLTQGGNAPPASLAAGSPSSPAMTKMQERAMHQQLIHALTSAGASGLAAMRGVASSTEAVPLPSSLVSASASSGSPIGASAGSGSPIGVSVVECARGGGVPDAFLSSSALMSSPSSSPFFGMSISAGFGSSSSPSSLSAGAMQRALALAAATNGTGMEPPSHPGGLDGTNHHQQHPLLASSASAALQGGAPTFLAAFGSSGNNGMPGGQGEHSSAGLNSGNGNGNANGMATRILQGPPGSFFAAPGRTAPSPPTRDVSMLDLDGSSMGHSAGGDGGNVSVVGGGGGNISPFEAFLRAHALQSAKNADGSGPRSVRPLSPFLTAGAQSQAQGGIFAMRGVQAGATLVDASSLGNSASHDTLVGSGASLMDLDGVAGQTMSMLAHAGGVGAGAGLGSSKDSHSANDPLLQRCSSDARSLARSDSGRVAPHHHSLGVMPNERVPGGKYLLAHKRGGEELSGRQNKRSPATLGLAGFPPLDDVLPMGHAPGGNAGAHVSPSSGAHMSPGMAAAAFGGSVTNGVLASLQLPPPLVFQPQPSPSAQPPPQSHTAILATIVGGKGTPRATAGICALPRRPELEVSIPQGMMSSSSANGGAPNGGGVPAPLTPVYTPTHTPTGSHHSNSHTSDSSNGVERPGQGAWASSPLADCAFSEIDSQGNAGGEAANAGGVAAVEDSAARMRREKRKNQRAVAKGKAAPATSAGNGTPSANAADVSSEAKRITKLEAENRSLNMRLAFVNRLNSEQTLRIEELEAELAAATKKAREMRTRLGEVEPETI